MVVPGAGILSQTKPTITRQVGSGPRHGKFCLNPGGECLLWKSVQADWVREKVERVAHIKDRNLKFLRKNQRLGKSSQEVINLKTSEFFHPKKLSRSHGDIIEKLPAAAGNLHASGGNRQRNIKPNWHDRQSMSKVPHRKKKKRWESLVYSWPAKVGSTRTRGTYRRCSKSTPEGGPNVRSIRHPKTPVFRRKNGRQTGLFRTIPSGETWHPQKEGGKNQVRNRTHRKKPPISRKNAQHPNEPQHPTTGFLVKSLGVGGVRRKRG